MPDCWLCSNLFITTTLVAQKRNNTNNNVVDSGNVIQKLTIDKDSNSTISITNQKNVSLKTVDHMYLNGSDDMGTGYQLLSLDNNSPMSFTVTYDNLSKITYNDRKITKIVYDVTEYPRTDANSLAGDFEVTKDFYYGFQYYWASKANIKARFYYADGSLVDFSDGNAYLSVNSLNNYTNWLQLYSIEGVRVNSGGKALALRGSSVTVHNGNYLYADKANSFTTDGHYAATRDEDWNRGFTNNPYATTDSNIPEGWDLQDSSYRYYGSGLIKLSGTELNIDVIASDNGIPTRVPGYSGNISWRSGMWYNTSTIIPVTPTTQIDYHYNVSLANRLNSLIT